MYNIRVHKCVHNVSYNINYDKYNIILIFIIIYYNTISERS